MIRLTNRNVHRWLSIVVAIPFFVVVITGCLLHVKRWVPALQPPSQKSEQGAMKPDAVGWDVILTALKGVPAADVKSWKDVKAIDVRPALGVARARTSHGYEVQVDLASGKVLSQGQRWSTVLIEMHEGAYFGPWVRNWVFLPTAIFMLILNVTGVWLLAKHYVFKPGRKTWGLRLFPRQTSVSA